MQYIWLLRVIVLAKGAIPVRCHFLTCDKKQRLNTRLKESEEISSKLDIYIKLGSVFRSDPIDSNLIELQTRVISGPGCFNFIWDGEALVPISISYVLSPMRYDDMIKEFVPFFSVSGYANLNLEIFQNRGNIPTHIIKYINSYTTNSISSNF